MNTKRNAKKVKISGKFAEHEPNYRAGVGDFAVRKGQHYVLAHPVLPPSRSSSPDGTCGSIPSSLPH